MNEMEIALSAERVKGVWASQGSQDRILEAVLDSAMEMTAAEEGGVLAVADDISCLRLQVWRGPGVDLKNLIIPMDPEKSVCASTVATGKPAIVPDVKMNERFLPMSESHIRSELVVPVLSRGKTLGVVNLESHCPHHFTAQHLEDLRAFCEAVSPYWEMTTYQTRLDSLKEQHAAIAKVADTVLSGSPATLRAILDAALTLTRADIGGILVLNHEGKGLEIREAVQIRQGSVGTTIEEGRGVVWRCLRTQEIQCLGDVTQDPDYLDLSEGMIRSLLAAPLVKEGKPIGVINIESSELNHFTLDDYDALRIFANQSAIAVANAELLEQLQAAHAIASLGSISGNLAHRMNNVVGGIRVLAGLLAKDIAKHSAELEARARQIESAAVEALGVVQTYDKRFRGDEQSFDFVDMITQVVNQISRGAAEIRVSAPETRVIVRTSRRQMTEVATEMIGNALKSVGNSGNIEVIVEETDLVVKLTVCDNGRGISEEILPHIFTRGFSGREGAQSMGFGLWWMRTFLRMIGGDISAHNRESGGAVFSAVFPKNITMKDS